MAIQVGWGNSNRTIILYTFDGAWTWHEFHAAIDIARRLMSTVNYPVKTIIDMTDGDDLPSRVSLRLNTMNHIKLLVQQTAASDTVVVGVKPLIKALWDTFRALSAPNHSAATYFVKTREEAYYLLASKVESKAAS